MMPHSHKAIRAVYVSIAGNTLLAVVKGVAGYTGNSFALMADAIESTADIFSSILLLLGLAYATRPPDQNHPYGHGRAESLMTFAVVGFLVVSATFIAVQSVHNIQTPQQAPEVYTLWILLAIIIIKEASYRYMAHKSRQTGSTSLKADAWHHRADAITSVCAFIGIAIAVWMGDEYATAEDWAALIASAIIMYNAWLIFRPALGEIMDEQLHPELIDGIRKVARQVDGVMDTEKCFVRKTGMSYYVDLHAIVDGQLSVVEGHQIAHRLQDRLREEWPEIIGVLVHVEPHDANYSTNNQT